MFGLFKKKEKKTVPPELKEQTTEKQDDGILLETPTQTPDTPDMPYDVPSSEILDVQDAADAIEDTSKESSETILEEISEEIVPADLAIIDENQEKKTGSQVEVAMPPKTDDNIKEGASIEKSLSWAERLKKGLEKSRQKLGKSLVSVFGGGQIDEDLYEELEAILLTSDMGIEATEHLLAEVRERVTLKGLKNSKELKDALSDALYELLLPLEAPLIIDENKKPFVLMLAGVNGAGKTTSIGKLAKYYQSEGKRVLLAAGDTFRAAAREQLIEWGDRNHVDVISQEKADSAAVCFDAIEAAKARGVDVVLADTAGRLPTQMHLMEEIKKVKRVIQKSIPDAPHEVILVLDANIGQNTLNQVLAFDDALGLTGLILTKLDGTAKGGVVASLAKNRPIPIRFIGVGEGIDDLRPFVAKDFVAALLDE